MLDNLPPISEHGPFDPWLLNNIASHFNEKPVKELIDFIKPPEDLGKMVLLLMYILYGDKK